MTVCFRGIKELKLDRQERIAELICERVALLVGKKWSSYIGSVSFCANLEDCEKNEAEFLIERQALIRFKSLDERLALAHICLNKEMLFNLLIPGPGQAEFDELFLKIRNVLYENIKNVIKI